MSGVNFLTGATPYMFLIFFVPGAIILYIRSQLTTGRLPPPSERLLSYLIVSTIYLALTLPYISYQPELGISNLGTWGWLIWLFVVPSIIGLALAFIQKERIRNSIRSAMARIGLNPVHPIPTAWDWKFSNDNSNQWVLVTLTDGSQVAGHLGSDSFVSSNPAERDIYIQKIYALDPVTGNWQETGDKTGDRGILIAPRQVQTIEFWPYDTRRELDNED